jgi:hypothetical protein
MTFVDKYIKKIRSFFDNTYEKTIEKYNAIDEFLEIFIYTKTKFNYDRNNIFLFIAAGLKRNTSLRDLLDTLIEMYEDEENEKAENHNNFILKIKEKSSILHTVYCKITGYGSKNYKRSIPKSLELLRVLKMDHFEGITFDVSLRNNNWINEYEFNVLRFSKTEYDGLEYIIEQQKNINNIGYAIMMLFLPAMFVSTAYFIFQPDMAAFTNQLLEPINNLSKKPIEIPAYMKDRTMFGLIAFSIYATFFGIVYMLIRLKNENPKMYFKVFPLVEKEFILNTVTPLYNFLIKGISFGEAVPLIYSDKKGSMLTKRIYSDMDDMLKRGDKRVYKVFQKYGIDKRTVAFLKIGAENDALVSSLKNIIDYNQTSYDKTVKRLVFTLPLIGQIIMVFILLIPLIDIILLTTVGVMSFTI